MGVVPNSILETFYAIIQQSASNKPYKDKCRSSYNNTSLPLFCLLCIASLPMLFEAWVELTLLVLPWSSKSYNFVAISAATESVSLMYRLFHFPRTHLVIYVSSVCQWRRLSGISHFCPRSLVSSFRQQLWTAACYFCRFSSSAVGQ